MELPRRRNLFHVREFNMTLESEAIHEAVETKRFARVSLALVRPIIEIRVVEL